MENKELAVSIDSDGIAEREASFNNSGDSTSTNNNETNTESIDYKLPEWPQASVKKSNDSTPISNDNETKTERSVIEPKDFQALIREKMESENLSFPEAREQVLKERKIDAVGSPVKVDLKKEITTLAFKDYNQYTGKFGWNYPANFQQKLNGMYPYNNFELDDIKKVCFELNQNGILHGKYFEYGQKYVFEQKNLKV